MLQPHQRQVRAGLPDHCGANKRASIAVISRNVPQNTPQLRNIFKSSVSEIAWFLSSLQVEFSPAITGMMLPFSSMEQNESAIFTLRDNAIPETKRRAHGSPFI